jgi:hypothetical protein
VAARAILFGLNYRGCEVDALNGCIKDVKRAADYLRARLPGGVEVDVVTDDFAPEK